MEVQDIDSPWREGANIRKVELFLLQIQIQEALQLLPQLRGEDGGKLMDFQDYVPGSSYLLLLQSDFKSEYRFRQYARFMKQDCEQQIIVPIDYGRAVKEANRRANDVRRAGFDAPKTMRRN